LDKEYVSPGMIPRSSETHAGEDVAHYAVGPMSQLLSGVHEQNFIAHAAAYAACLGPYKDCLQKKMASGSACISSCFILSFIIAILVCKVRSFGTNI